MINQKEDNTPKSPWRKHLY